MKKLHYFENISLKSINLLGCGKNFSLVSNKRNSDFSTLFLRKKKSFHNFHNINVTFIRASGSLMQAHEEQNKFQLTALDMLSLV